MADGVNPCGSVASPAIRRSFRDTQPGTHMRDIDGAWQTLRARAGLEGVRLHDLRHYIPTPRGLSRLGGPADDRQVARLADPRVFSAGRAPDDDVFPARPPVRDRRRRRPVDHRVRVAPGSGPEPRAGALGTRPGGAAGRRRRSAPHPRPDRVRLLGAGSPPPLRVTDDHTGDDIRTRSRAALYRCRATVLVWQPSRYATRAGESPDVAIQRRASYAHP